MFWEIAHYALILMIELAQGCRKNGVELSRVAKKYDLPVSTFDDILERLVVAGYTTYNNGKLFLQIEPDKISIWDIINSIDNIQGAALKPNKQHLQTSTAVMVDKEIELVLKMIQYRFKHQKLSSWSEKASKMIYI